jgi:hypothetical protein
LEVHPREGGRVESRRRRRERERWQEREEMRRGGGRGGRRAESVSSYIPIDAEVFGRALSVWAVARCGK